MLEIRQRQMQMNETASMQGNFFGQVLVLLNLGFVEQLTERELDEMVCGADETTSIAKLREVTCDTLDVLCYKKIPNCTHSSDSAHKYSLPVVYGVGEASGGGKLLNSTKDQTFQKMPYTS